jgi:uncharacterized protein with HEPN domain
MSKGRKAAVDRMRHMLSAVEAIERYVDRGREAFDNDSAIREATVYQIVVLGEAAKAAVAADASVEQDFPDIEWSLLAKMRDKVTHQYWAVDREIVWSTAERDVPKIKVLLTAALNYLL